MARSGEKAPRDLGNQLDRSISSATLGRLACEISNREVIDMLDKQTRGAILLLRRNGQSLRCISRLLSLSRDSVRKVAKLGSDEPPMIRRPRKLDAHSERIVQMLAKFDGNVVKVHRAWPTPVRPSDIQR